MFAVQRCGKQWLHLSCWATRINCERAFSWQTRRMWNIQQQAADALQCRVASLSRTLFRLAIPPPLFLPLLAAHCCHAQFATTMKQCIFLSFFPLLLFFSCSFSFSLLLLRFYCAHFVLVPLDAGYPVTVTSAAQTITN